MPLLHDCPGCRYPGVPYNEQVCAACWARLPDLIRCTIIDAKGGSDRAMRRAVKTAASWLAANPVT